MMLIQFPASSGGLIAAAVVAFVFTSAPGCSLQSRRSQELLEARLRSQEDAIVGLEQRLQDSQSSLAAVRQENDLLRGSGDHRTVSLSPEEADPTFRMNRIELSSLLSGGLDRDNLPGDESFTVLLTPQDHAGKTLRPAGSLQLQLLDFGRPASEQRIGLWSFDRTQTDALWHDGVVGKGFQLTSDWQQAPQSQEVTVHARFVTVDGRQFDTTGKLRVDVGNSDASPPAARPLATSAAVPTAPAWTKSRSEPGAVNPVPPLLPE